MKKLILCLGLILCVGQISYASAISMYSSVTSTGKTAGGFRYDLGSGWVIDGTLGITDDGTGTETTQLDYFVDCYYGLFGVAVAGGETTKSTVSGMLAIEQPITDAISIGIASTLISYTEDKAVGVLTGYDIYLVLGL